MAAVPPLESERGGLVLTDALRGVAIVSLAVATIGWGYIGFALLFLVLGGTMLPRALGARAPLDFAFCAVIIFGAWAALLDWYVAVSWLDLVVHAALVGLLAAVGYRTLQRLDVVPPEASGAHTIILTTCMGATLALLWEFGEWFGHTWLDDAIQVGYDDTLGDLAASAGGALLAGLMLARRPRETARP